MFVWNLAHHYSNDGYKKIIILHVNDRLSDKSRTFELPNILSYCQHDIQIKNISSLGIIFRILDKIEYHFPLIGRILKRIMFIYDDDNRKDELPNRGTYRGFFHSGKNVEKNISTYLDELKQFLSNYAKRPLLEEAPPIKALHIRRGDYINASKKIGLIPLNFYLTELNTSTNTIICTDADKNDEIYKYFDTKVKVYSSSETSSLESFILLIESSELVISNSTFSWWAAVISNKMFGTKVIAPSLWSHLNKTQNSDYAMSFFEYRNIDFLDKVD